MSIEIKCASCGSEYTVRNDAAGKQVRCSNCQAIIVVPETASPETTEAASESEQSVPKPVKCGFATASLVFGILGFILLPCIGQLLAVIFGFAALSKISASKGRMIGNGRAIAGVVLGFVWILFVPIIAIMAGMLLPAFARAREESRKTICRSNLKQIGIAVSMYSNDYGGFPPSGRKDSLGNLSLLYNSYINASVIFRCPSTNDNPVGMVPGKPFLPHQCSYEYIALAPTGPNGNLPPDAIIAFDKEENHRGTGRNVLFHNGSVKWMPEQSFRKRFEDQEELRNRYQIVPQEVEEGEVLKIEIEER